MVATVIRGQFSPLFLLKRFYDSSEDIINGGANSESALSVDRTIRALFALQQTLPNITMLISCLDRYLLYDFPPFRTTNNRIISYKNAFQQAVIERKYIFFLTLSLVRATAESVYQDLTAQDAQSNLDLNFPIRRCLSNII